MEFRPRHDQADQELHGELTAIDFTHDPGKTIQEPTEDADINVLMRRMGVKDGSVLPRFDNPKAMYGDFSEWPSDPVELADMLHEGQLAFQRLPAELRKRYGTPEELFNFMNNDENYEEAVKLGLLERKPVKKELVQDATNKAVSSSTSSVKEPLVQKRGEPRDYEYQGEAFPKKNNRKTEEIE